MINDVSVEENRILLSLNFDETENVPAAKKIDEIVKVDQGKPS